MGIKRYIKKFKNDYVINKVERTKIPNFKQSPNIRNKIIFSGRVQNIGFRLEIYELANRLNLIGWVRNRDDGAVEMEVQGENEKILFLINNMKSLKRANVTDVEINELNIRKDETAFIVIR